MPEFSFTMLVQILIPVTVFIIMICLGLELKLADFRRVFRFPRAILTGVIGQMILMPAMAFAIAATLGRGNLISADWFSIVSRLSWRTIIKQFRLPGTCPC